MPSRIKAVELLSIIWPTIRSENFKESCILHRFSSILDLKSAVCLIISHKFRCVDLAQVVSKLDREFIAWKTLHIVWSLRDFVGRTFRVWLLLRSVEIVERKGWFFPRVGIVRRDTMKSFFFFFLKFFRQQIFKKAMQFFFYGRNTRSYINERESKFQNRYLPAWP